MKKPPPHGRRLYSCGMDAPDIHGRKEDGGIGPMAGAVIVVILVALGGLYFFWQENQRIHTPPVQETLNA